jgi:hypothetical protein
MATNPSSGWLYASFGVMSDSDKTLDDLTLTLALSALSP